MKKIIFLIVVAIILVVAFSSKAFATKTETEETEKVFICHRTDAATNPYVKIEVDADAADGDTGNDNGQGDHSEHTGPVATSEAIAQALKDNKENWGDIIPPHHDFGGLNWSDAGQAIYGNDCNFAVVTPTPTGSVTPTITPTVTPDLTPSPTAGASATPTPTTTVTNNVTNNTTNNTTNNNVVPTAAPATGRALVPCTPTTCGWK